MDSGGSGGYLGRCWGGALTPQQEGDGAEEQRCRDQVTRCRAEAGGS